LRNVGVTGGGLSADIGDQTEPQSDADIEAEPDQEGDAQVGGDTTAGE
jgi:hypothetical protein